MRIALFITCIGDTLFPEAGRATVQVLEQLGHEVAFPEEQACCGQMHINSGYREDGLALARRFVRIFEPFDAVVSPSSSCVGNVRAVFPALAHEAGDDELAERVAVLGQRVLSAEVAPLPTQPPGEPGSHQL